MSEPGAGAAASSKPRLKINVNRNASFVGDASTTPGGATPSDSARKVKLKLSSQPATPAEGQTPSKTKAGRQPKPTAKLVESKKRQRDDDDDDAPLAASAPPATKIKIRGGVGGAGGAAGGRGGMSLSKARAKAAAAAHTQLVLKARGRPPVHPPGDGYDSEASDREMDPAIEEQFIMRMVPGEHCDYVRQCMETGKMGLSKAAGGADVQMKFFDEDSRRAVVTVKGQRFAAVMVDLPTITESMKTWDRKSLLKAADVCQMLLVFQRVASDDEAKKVALPTMIDVNFKWPHGLTPPMHDCINRRFAKTISRKEIENKETEVERLLADDALADRTAWEWVDERNDEDADADADADGEDVLFGDEDAEGEMDDSAVGYYDDASGAVDDDADLVADLEAAFADDLVADTPATGVEGATPLTTTQANTPAPGVHPSIELDASDEEDEDDASDDDDDDDDDDDLDEDQRAARDEAQGVKDIINDMQRQLAHRTADLEKTTNKILRQRVESQIKQLKSEIELKMSSIGLETDD